MEKIKRLHNSHNLCVDCIKSVLNSFVIKIACNKLGKITIISRLLIV